MSRATIPVLLAALAVPPAALADAPPEKPDAVAIARWIEQLGDDDFNKREEASQTLEAAGEAALPALQDAADTNADPEIRARAARIVRAIGDVLWPRLRTISGGTPGYWWNRVAFTADGKQAVVTGGGVFLYDLATGKDVYRGAMEVQGARRGLCLSGDRGRFLTGHTNDPVMRLGDVKTGNELLSFVGNAAGVTATALSPDGAYAVSAADDKTLRIWDANTGKELRRCPGIADAPLCVTFAPKDAVFASGDGPNGSHSLIRLWDPATGKEVKRITGPDASVYAIAFLPDGKSLLAARSDGLIQQLDVHSGKEIRRMKHDGAVYDVAVSPDGSRALSAGYDDNTVRLWDLTTGRELRRFTDHAARVLGVAISPDGNRGLSCDANQTMILWQLAK